ncbi:MAG: DUF4325 domain-containing protein [Proteobacteria bacterium]|nr:DUF4325 domain-containing protein [Pseudomonadota bacterium]
MAGRSRQSPLVREFILRNIANHPSSIGRLAAKEFRLSRTAISGYMRRLLKEELVTATGKTNARLYALKDIVDISLTLDVTALSSEDVVWRFRILPHMRDVNQNIVDLCQYGFTEMFNNVIDHSVSDDSIISYKQSYLNITIMIIDHGVGIFEKIQRDFNLLDPRSALLELSKGKLTSDKDRHSGEGIFFTSRMFDKFSIYSGSLFYSRELKGGDEWMIEVGDVENRIEGTTVKMEISTDAKWTMREVFDKYEGDNTGFRKTHVPIKLSNYPGEQLVSRSQAKRVLTRFNNFSEVLLDFDGVENIGQAFADEIFRVFKIAHPEIRLFAIRTNPDVQRIIDRVLNSTQEQNNQN